MLSRHLYGPWDIYNYGPQKVFNFVVPQGSSYGLLISGKYYFYVDNMLVMRILFSLRKYKQWNFNSYSVFPSESRFFTNLPNLYNEYWRSVGHLKRRENCTCLLYRTFLGFIFRGTIVGYLLGRKGTMVCKLLFDLLWVPI